ncbi:MAG: hypothetical protein ACTSUG_12955 [Candidatus Helarchaeota archaeon]
MNIDHQQIKVKNISMDRRDYIPQLCINKKTLHIGCLKFKFILEV